MPQFRKKPVVIEAYQYRASEQDGRVAAEALAGDVRYPEDGTMLIRTLEGVMCAQPGDWIIRGVKGELYPCKPDIFAATYDPVGETTFQQRVIAERAELYERLGKLLDFLGGARFLSLPEDEQGRMRRQAEAMNVYAGVLGDRIAAFGKT